MRKGPKSSITVEGRKDKITIVVDGTGAKRIKLSMRDRFAGRTQLLPLLIALAVLVVEIIQTLQNGG